MSFVKNAPEIAEEILLKAASLPEGLRSFSRSLLEKQAVDTREKLQLPTRMTLADLQKMAHSNEVDLPKVASVKSDDFADIASQLRKVAERRDEDLAHEIFETAVALVASKQTKEAAVPRLNLTAPPTLLQRVRAGIMPHSPIGQEVREFHARGEQRISGVEAKTPGSKAYAAETEREHAKKWREQQADKEKSHATTTRGAIKALPAIATGSAAAVIGAGKLTEKDKSTTINTEKLIGAGR